MKGIKILLLKDKNKNRQFAKTGYFLKLNSSLIECAQTSSCAKYLVKSSKCVLLVGTVLSKLS